MLISLVRPMIDLKIDGSCCCCFCVVVVCCCCAFFALCFVIVVFSFGVTCIPPSGDMSYVVPNRTRYHPISITHVSRGRGGIQVS